MLIPRSVIRNYLIRVGKQELRDTLYDITPHIDPEVVDIFAEVAKWDQERRPRKRNVAAEVLRIIRPGRK